MKKISVLTTRNKRILLGAGVLVLAILLIYIFFFRTDPVVKEGRNYLHEQSQLKTEDIASKLKTRKSNELKAMLDNGSIDILSVFNDFALFGDSRAYGFSSFGLLDPNWVLAGAGNTIMNITDQKDLIASAKPSKLIFSYGVNDMGLNIGGDEENGYSKTYEQQIDQLLEVDPDAQVFVCSIIDVTQEAKDRSPNWTKAKQWNEQLKAMCEKRGWTFVDNDSLGTDLSHYQGDGVHFTSEFTEQWAKNIGSVIWEKIYG